MLTLLTAATTVALITLALPLAAQSTPDSVARSASDTLRVQRLEDRTATAASRRVLTESATRAPTALRDVPQAVTVIGQEQLRNQQAALLAEVVQNIPGVTTVTAYNDFTMRGFRTEAGNFAVNGQRGGANVDTYQPQSLYTVERVEGLRGPAGVLFGNGSPGGVLNVVTKQPLASRRATVEVTSGSFGTFRTMLDAGGALDGAKRIRSRFVAGYENSDNLQQFIKTEHLMLAPSIGAALDAATDVTVQATYFRQEQSGGGWYNRGILAPNGDLNALPLSWTGHEAEDQHPVRAWSLQAAVRRRLGKGQLTLLARADRNNYHQQYHHLNFGGLQADGRTLTRQYRDFDATNSNRLLNAYANVPLATGAVQHALTIGADLGVLRYGFDYAQSGANVPSLDIFAPVYGQGQRELYRGDRYSTNYADQTRYVAGYLQDQITLTPRLRALVAVRFDSYRFRYRDLDRTAQVNDPAEPIVETNDTSAANVVLPRAGLVYRASEALSLYGSWSQGFQPQFSNFLNSGGPFDPERSTQFEVGAKFEPASSIFSADVAVYSITKRNILVPDLADPTRLQQAGAARSEGIETGVRGRPVRGLELIGSYAFNRARITAGETEQIGRALPNAPQHLASLFALVDVGAGVRVGGGMRHASSFATFDAGDFRIPGYATVDLNAAFDIGRYRAVGALVNVFDKRYFIGSFGADANWPGAPRSVRFTLGADL